MSEENERKKQIEKKKCIKILKKKKKSIKYEKRNCS